MSSDAKGYAFALIGTGAIIMYAGIKGLSIGSAIQNLVTGKSPLAATLANQINIVNPTPSSTPGSTPSGSNPAGGNVANPSTANATPNNNDIINGTIIYKYLRSHGYTPMQAAGAVASMWGESQWNPESAGTGGWGLMGWTGNFADIRTGNAPNDMAKELPLILQYVSQFGDQPAVDSMKNAGSVLASANIWGPQVEKFGINDVHPEGVSQAQQIAKSVDGVSLP